MTGVRLNTCLLASELAQVHMHQTHALIAHIHTCMHTVYVSTQTHTHTHTHIHTHIHRLSHTFPAHTSHTHRHIHTLSHTHIHTHTHTHFKTSQLRRLRPTIWTRNFTQSSTIGDIQIIIDLANTNVSLSYIHTHIHTHIHMHTQTQTDCTDPDKVASGKIPLTHTLYRTGHFQQSVNIAIYDNTAMPWPKALVQKKTLCVSTVQVQMLV
jgi:hypothetical protein